MKYMMGRGVNWRPMTQTPNIEPMKTTVLIVEWWGKADFMHAVKDENGKMRWNCSMDGDVLSDENEIDTRGFTGWMYMPEPRKEAK